MMRNKYDDFESCIFEEDFIIQRYSNKEEFKNFEWPTGVIYNPFTNGSRKNPTLFRHIYTIS